MSANPYDRRPATPAARRDPPRLIARYAASSRLNHWIVAILFFCAALTGLAFFHPYFYPLVHLFGGGPWARILHPFFGVAMVALFLGLFFRLARHNVWRRHDSAWLRHANRMLAGDKAGLPPAGRYNAGQKIIFWVMALSLLVLIVTGVMFWRPYFAYAFPIWAVRLATLLHAAAATVLILSIIVHVYAAIWVKGTMRAMTRGTVTESWARRNHPLWFDEVASKDR
ncbi:MAG: formate dehydrogenase subunit gamma [Burkholderiaceae bacterium]